jgi:uncharacterized protein (DUF4415 family)
MAKNKRTFPDDDIPEMTEANFARAKPMRNVMPKVVEAMKRGRGRPKLAEPKARVSLRLDSAVVAAYKATGEGWQSRINDTLAHAIGIKQGKARGRSEKRA